MLDAQSLRREGLRQFLAWSPDLAPVIGGDPAQAETLLQQHAPAVVFLYIRPHTRDGLSLATRLVRAPCAPLLLASVPLEGAWLLPRLRRLGLSGAVADEAEPIELRRAFDALLAGDQYWDARLHHIAEDRLAGLTEREWEVFELVGRAATNQIIAATLSITDDTVETHVSRILQKLDVPTRGKAAALLWTQPQPAPLLAA